ncbi:NIPA protein 2 [Phytophthora cinnamomi]|uniref:NIPA protein 2 n=1 Tax=Phytophthora cinnamomi TaxID=4785 RepID=UPI003559501C|nr:NIPA protein 2 [Phytophthora cinnamomi]
MTGVARVLLGADDDADNVQGKWIGLAIVIASAVLSNLGVNVQKLSHVREEDKPVFERQTYYTRPLWLTGLVLVVLGAIGDFEALGFAPQALVASVGGGFTVLANVFFAHLWLGQVLTRSDVLGTLLIIIGVVLSTVANEPDEQMSLLELEKQFFQLGFLVYLGVMTAVLGGIFGQIEAISRLPRALNESKYRLLPFMYATASGIFGSFSVLLAKCASILLILTFSGENQFVYFTTYLFMGGMMCTLVLQTDLLNRAIMAGDTLSVFPMFQCFWIGSSVIGGVVFYEKYTRFSFFDWICLPIALAFIIMGIYLLAKHGESDGDDLEDPEHTTPGHRAHLTGHFGALMPLSPQGHSYSRKSFDDRENEHTPLRYTPSNGRVSDHSGLVTGYTNGYTNYTNGHTNGFTNGHDHGHRNGHPVGHWHGPQGRRHHGDDLEEQRLYSGSI